MTEDATELGPQTRSDLSRRVADHHLSDTIGARLQALRKRFGMSQRELARRADVTNSTLSMIEQGKVSPSIGSLEKILLAFPVSLQEFFSPNLGISSPVISADELSRSEHLGGIRETLSLENSAGMLRGFLHRQMLCPGSSSSAERRLSAGTLNGMILSGSCDLVLEGVRYPLRTGDAFQFSALSDHLFKNASDADCTFVSIFLPDADLARP